MSFINNAVGGQQVEQVSVKMKINFKNSCIRYYSLWLVCACFEFAIRRYSESMVLLEHICLLI